MVSKISGMDRSLDRWRIARPVLPSRRIFGCGVEQGRGSESSSGWCSGGVRGTAATRSRSGVAMTDLWARRQKPGWLVVQSFEWLASDLGDKFEILVHMQDGQPGQLTDCGDQEVWRRRRSVMSEVDQLNEHFESAIFDCGVRYSTGMLASGGFCRPERRSPDDLAE